jgi:hypothetical protein
MQRGKELIDCSTTSIFISPSLLRKLELPHNTAFTSTQSLNGQVMISARESGMASLLVEHFEHLEPVDESKDLVVPIKTHDLVLGMPWFKVRNPAICWSKDQLTALRMPNSLQHAKIPEADRASLLPECSEENTGDVPPLDIQLLGATAFGHHFTSMEMV